MLMPVLIPIRLPTQGLPFWRQWLHWCTAVRSWQLAEDWRCCYQGRVFVIPSGFVFDGASFPRGLWGGLSPTGLLLVPGIVHDFAYRYDYIWALDDAHHIVKADEGAGKKHWDRLFYQVGREANGMALIHGLVWGGLALFGGVVWRRCRRTVAEPLLPKALVVIDRESR
ncbi:DUF1353 domain-containing protein [Vibrio tubiashii]|uniref:DUF1353 domain-containing protein n=2 Tax=Vibrio tubiashii TaxID=29498 RepID=UPI0031F2EC3B